MNPNVQQLKKFQRESDMFVMCRDTPTYDIMNNKILNNRLIPRQFKNREDFDEWKKARLYIKSNGASRDLLQSIPENWVERKRQLSLSDCYWIKHDIDKAEFSRITPYLNDFISLRFRIRNSSVPAQTLGGSFTKEWIVLPDGSRVMRKLGFEEHIDAEYGACTLADDLGIPCNKAVRENQNTILIYNISDTDWMLITFQQLGIKADGYSPKGIASAFADNTAEKKALVQVLFDAVVGNNDRHSNMGNLAVLKNANTGEYEFPPMFDFNLAHHRQKNFYLGAVSRTIFADGLAETAINILQNWGHIANQYWEQNRADLIQMLCNLIDGKSSSGGITVPQF